MGIKSIVSAFLVFRLELRSPSPLDAGLILLEWLRRPAIEVLFQQRQSGQERRGLLVRRLNQVYPF